MTTELIDQRIKELELIRNWLSQNIAIIDATIATMTVQSKTMEMLTLPVNPAEWWFKTLSETMWQTK